MEIGTERPVPFSSRSLSKVERNYSQIDKEALGTLWGVKKFHTYIFGRSFTLLTELYFHIFVDLSNTLKLFNEIFVSCTVFGYIIKQRVVIFRVRKM